MAVHHVWIRNLPPWAEPMRLLGPGAWAVDGRSAHAELPTHAAADLDARLRGVGLGGVLLEVEVVPPLPRAAVRAARTTDARRRRDASPGFTRPGCRLDAEGRVSLTPESLALAMGERARGRSVVDLGCGAGGNSIGFARAGCRVVAVERDGARLADAQHNARIYGVSDRIQFRRGDAAALVGELSGDLLFVDPPWGVDWSRARTSLVDLPLLGAALGARGFAELWAKVPPSFDIREVPGALPEAVYGVGGGDDRRVKFVLLRRAF